MRRWRPAAIWSWNIGEDEVCGICQFPFEMAAPDAAAPGDGCPPVWGRCDHCFHMPCIMKWLESQQSQGQEIPCCPMCRQEWEFRA